MAAITEDMQIEQNEVANEALVGPFPNREQYAVHLRHMNFGFLGKEVRADGASCRGRGGRRDGEVVMGRVPPPFAVARGGRSAVWLRSAAARGGVCCAARPATRLLG